jgi:para-nitrobenzyl esterase
MAITSISTSGLPIPGFRTISAADLLGAKSSLLRNETRPDLRDNDGDDPGHGRALFLPTTGDDVPPDPVGVPSTHSRRVEPLIGTTLEEANLGFGAEEFAAFDASDAVADLTASCPDAQGVLEQHGLHDPAVTPERALTASYTDLMFRSPSRRTARRHPGPTYVYEFSWRSPLHGAAHGIDVPFVFDTTESCRGIIGDAAPETPSPMRCTKPGSTLQPTEIPAGPYDDARIAMRFDSSAHLGKDTAPDD